MSLIDKVDTVQQVKDDFKLAEKLAEDVIALRNEVIGLSKKKELSREGYRALQKQKSKTAWISMGMNLSII